MKYSLILLALLTGCASYRPIIDTQGMDHAKYATDLRECQAYAEQVSPGANAAVGAVIGGGLSFILAVIGGGDRDMFTGIGATLGAAEGAASGIDGQKDIIRRCMSGRGYRVLH